MWQWYQDLLGISAELRGLPSDADRKALVKQVLKRVNTLRSGWFIIRYGVGLTVFMQAGRFLGRALVPCFPSAPPIVLDMGLAALSSLAWSLADIILTRKRWVREVRTVLREWGVPVCRSCGYNVTGVPQARCPECGQPFDAELQLILASRAEITEFLPGGAEKR